MRTPAIPFGIRCGALGPALAFAELVILCLSCTLVLSCGREPQAERPVIEQLRDVGPRSKSARVVAEWLLAEMLSPSGSAKRAKQARKRLDALEGGGMLEEFARGLDDSLHGRPEAASNHYLEVARSARDSRDRRAPFLAWFSINQAMGLRHQTVDLWKRWQPFVDKALERPGSIGWRARSELVEWALEEAWASATPDVDEMAVELYGCLTAARLAGPFGHGVAADAYRSFPPEASGPWPSVFEADPLASRKPRILEVQQTGCGIDAKEGIGGEGIYYVESFFELEEQREVLIAVQGALGVWVDDALVLERDIRQWGIWPRFGVQIALEPGRHRIVARIGEPSTSIRVMHPDGRPLGIKGDDDPDKLYALVPPRRTEEPNLVARYLKDERVIDPKTDLMRFVTAYLAHIDNSDDVASVLFEPLVGDTNEATGPVLTTAALFTEGDPLFDRSQTEELIRELSERAVERDPDLWRAQLSRLLGEAERRGYADIVTELEKLEKQFEKVSAVLLTLARVYGQLGWSPEHRRAVLEAVERFPDEPAALHAAVEIYDQDGEHDKADALVERILKLDRDSEIALSRALSRQDYGTALAELSRLAKRRPDRKDLAERIHDVMVRAGNTSETWKKLEAAIEKDPDSGRARLDMADAKFAEGHHGALRKALAEAVEAGADTSLLTNAIDLVEGMTALEPYRLEPRPIIEAYQQSGKHMSGNAARILDYAAIWVRSDGSSQMLEHEIVRLQDVEGIQKFAEHRRLEGLVLQMRVIKQDGTTLEPEDIPGKPTVTFPHLEVGDYIETEQVIYMQGDGSGERYVGPRWFFREENVAYARSEYVVVAPADKNIVVETTGNVPEPEVDRDGAFVARRWRVDFSPAAPAEPASVPVTEFLPSVRLAWGVTLDDHLARLSDAVADPTPTDPRIVRVAERIAEPVPKKDPLGRTRRLYRWVLDNVEPGEESDGRRVVISKRGNRWRAFLTLADALGLQAQYAVAKNRLAPPPVGPVSKAQQYVEPVIRVRTRRGDVWLNLNEKFAPFGYVPAEVRGMPAFLLDETTEKVQLPAEGAEDGLSFEGSGKLAANGSLTLELREKFSGKLAMAMRSGLSQLPEQRLRDAIESNLLQRALASAELVDFDIEGRDDLDASLVVEMKVKLDRFAQVEGKRLVISPPFVLSVGRLTSLPSRQTPLLIGESIHRQVDVEIQLPKGARARVPDPQEVKHDGRKVSRDDAIKGRRLVLRRTIHLPAGRVQPENYREFAAFTDQADELQTAPIVVELK